MVFLARMLVSVIVVVTMAMGMRVIVRVAVHRAVRMRMFMGMMQIVALDLSFTFAATTGRTHMSFTPLQGR